MRKKKEAPVSQSRPQVVRRPGNEIGSSGDRLLVPKKKKKNKKKKAQPPLKLDGTSRARDALQ